MKNVHDKLGERRYLQAADHVVRVIQERGVHSICFGSLSHAVVSVDPKAPYQFGIPSDLGSEVKPRSRPR